MEKENYQCGEFKSLGEFSNIRLPCQPDNPKEENRISISEMI